MKSCTTGFVIRFLRVTSAIGHSRGGRSIGSSFRPVVGVKAQQRARKYCDVCDRCDQFCAQLHRVGNHGDFRRIQGHARKASITTALFSEFAGGNIQSSSANRQDRLFSASPTGYLFQPRSEFRHSIVPQHPDHRRIDARKSGPPHGPSLDRAYGREAAEDLASEPRRR